MSWFSQLIGDDNDDEGRQVVFKGDWEKTSRELGPLPDAISTIMNYAMNTGGNAKHRGVREVGEKMIFEMKNIEVDMRSEDGETKGGGVIGDYEIEVRRVG